MKRVVITHRAFLRRHRWQVGLGCLAAAFIFAVAWEATRPTPEQRIRALFESIRREQYGHIKLGMPRDQVRGVMADPPGPALYIDSAIGSWGAELIDQDRWCLTGIPPDDEDNWTFDKTVWLRVDYHNGAVISKILHIFTPDHPSPPPRWRQWLQAATDWIDAFLKS